MELCRKGKGREDNHLTNDGVTVGRGRQLQDIGFLTHWIVVRLVNGSGESWEHAGGFRTQKDFLVGILSKPVGVVRIFSFSMSKHLIR